jgi:hypothetical protein
MSSPRRITASEILADRRALFESGTNWPHDYNAHCGVWVYCDCPKCRDYYDPTGEECAKYLNMDPASFFTDQSDLASFSMTKIAKESLWYAATPGIYFDDDARVRTLDGFIDQMTPPLAIRPSHILHIGKDYTVDRFFLSADKTSWIRRTWKSGRSVYYADNPPIPADAICSRLKELFA